MSKYDDAITKAQEIIESGDQDAIEKLQDILKDYERKAI